MAASKTGSETFGTYPICLPLSLSFKNPLLLAIKGNRSCKSMMENAQGKLHSWMGYAETHGLPYLYLESSAD
jgi:hypothetical protein